MEMTNSQNIRHDEETINHIFEHCKENVNCFLDDNPKIKTYVFGGLTIIAIIGSVVYGIQK